MACDVEYVRNATMSTGIPRPIARSMMKLRLLSDLLMDTDEVVAILYRRRLMTSEAETIPNADM